MAENDDNLRRRASRMARLQAGVTAAARAFTAEERTPADGAIFRYLLEKHPDEPREAVEAALRQAKEAGRDVAGEDLAWQPKQHLDSASLRASFMQRSTLFSPGMDGRVTVRCLHAGRRGSAAGCPGGMWADDFKTPDALPPDWWRRFSMARHITFANGVRSPSVVRCAGSASARYTGVQILAVRGLPVGQFSVTLHRGV